MRIVPHYRSLEIALYLPKRGVEPRWVLQLFIVTIFVYIIAMPFLRLEYIQYGFISDGALANSSYQDEFISFQIVWWRAEIENALGV